MALASQHVTAMFSTPPHLFAHVNTLGCIPSKLFSAHVDTHVDAQSDVAQKLHDNL